MSRQIHQVYVVCDNFKFMLSVAVHAPVGKRYHTYVYHTGASCTPFLIWALTYDVYPKKTNQG